MKILTSKKVRYAILIAIALLVIANSYIGAPLGNKQRFSLGQSNTIITIGNPVFAAGVTPDYVTDGVQDYVQFRAAIAALPVNGGKLIIYGGVYAWTDALTTVNVTANITISGDGASVYFQGDGATPVFTSVGNNTVYEHIRTDAGAINMGVTTGWMWTNVTIDTQLYTYYAPTTGIGSVFDLTAEDALTVGSLTAGRVAIAGVGGLLGDDADLTFSGNTTVMATANITTLNAPTGRGATYVIATSNPANPSTTTAITQADVILDGTDDRDDIQALIADNTSLFFMAGTYDFIGHVIIEGITNLEIHGEKGAILTPHDQAIGVLTADTLTGSVTVVVNDASSFVTHMWVALVDGNSQYIGENRVINIDYGTNTLTLQSAASSDITVGQNGKIYGGGLIFRVYSAGAGLGGVDGFRFYNLTFDMNVANYTQFTRAQQADLCGYMQALRIAGNASNVDIFNLDVYDSWGYAMSLHGIEDANIQSNRVYNTGGGIILEGSGGNVIIASNRISGQKDRGNGIVAAGIATQDAERISVLNNIIEGNEYQYGIKVDVDSYDVLINGNIVYNVGTGIRTAGGVGTRGSNFIVSSNVINNSNLGIQNIANEAIVIGNTIKGYWDINGVYQLYTSGTNTLLANNLLSEGYREGIRVASIATGSTIRDNTVHNSNVGSGNFSGIMVDEASNVKVIGNVVSDNRTPKLVRYGASVNATATDIVLTGNDFRDYLVSGIMASSNSTTIEENLGYNTPSLSALDANMIYVPTNGGWNTDNTSNGEVWQWPFAQTVVQGNLVNSSARAYTVMYNLSDFANDGTGPRVNWDKRLYIWFNYTRYGSDVNTRVYFQLKEVSTHGDLADFGIGIYANNLSVFGQSYGAALYQPSLLVYGAATQEEHQILIEIDPKIPRVSWFVDGVLTASTSNPLWIPSGNSDATCYFVHSILGGNPAVSDTRSTVKNMWIWQER